MIRADTQSYCPICGVSITDWDNPCPECNYPDYEAQSEKLIAKHGHRAAIDWASHYAYAGIHEGHVDRFKFWQEVAISIRKKLIALEFNKAKEGCTT